MIAQGCIKAEVFQEGYDCQVNLLLYAICI